MIIYDKLCFNGDWLLVLKICHECKSAPDRNIFMCITYYRIANFIVRLLEVCTNNYLQREANIFKKSDTRSTKNMEYWYCKIFICSTWSLHVILYDPYLQCMIFTHDIIWPFSAVYELNMWYYIIYNPYTIHIYSTWSSYVVLYDPYKWYYIILNCDIDDFYMK